MPAAPDDPPPTLPRRPRRLLRWLAVLVVAYAGVCVAMWSLQNQMIFPGADSQGQQYATVPPSPAYDLVELRTRDGDRTFAAFVPARTESRQPHPTAVRQPTLIYFYGNGEHLAHALGAAMHFATMGVNVLVVEYVGYGMADGTPSEKSMYAAADAAYDHLLTRPDVDVRKLVPAGMSIGCAAAIDLASRRPCAGLICFSPFTSMPDMARQVAPWLPTRLLLTYRFDNAGKLPKFSGPVFLAHGRGDTIVPFHMSESLRTLVRGPLTFVPVGDAGHNDLFEAGADDLDRALRRFLDGL